MRNPAAVKEFIKLLSDIDNSKSNTEKFRDLCEAAYCGLAKLMAPSKERADQLEARYMMIEGRYKEGVELRALFGKLIGIAWNATMEGGIDFLGEVSGQLGSLDEDRGQFFTPYEVCRMMAKITIGDYPAYIDQHGYFTMSDPAVGAGALILATADELTALGYDTLHMLVYAVDVSALAFYMCYLQLTWRGVPAYVERGNSLSLETFEGAWTIPCLAFYERHGHLSFDPNAKSKYRPNENDALVRNLRRLLNLVKEADTLIDEVESEREELAEMIEPVSPLDETPEQDYPEPPLPERLVQLEMF